MRRRQFITFIGGAAALPLAVRAQQTKIPTIGFMGVSSEGEVIWNQASVVSAASHSITDLGHAMWDSVGGVVKVLNPVNIYDHLTGSNNDPNTQPTTAGR